MTLDSEDIGRLAYLLLLGVALGGWFVAEHRHNLGRLARMALAWGLIFLGVIAALGLWSDIRDDVLPRQKLLGAGLIEVPRSPDGHYYLVAELNGAPVRFVVDTGATEVVLSPQDARRAGIDPDGLAYLGRARTANGVVRTARVRIDEMRLGDIVERDLPVSVTEGEMDGSLLGMSYLRRFDSIEIRDGKLILRR